jgi:hypothetical protein
MLYPKLQAVSARMLELHDLICASTADREHLFEECSRYAAVLWRRFEFWHMFKIFSTGRFVSFHYISFLVIIFYIKLSIVRKLIEIEQIIDID